jgi:hypothetical protein
METEQENVVVSVDSAASEEGMPPPVAEIMAKLIARETEVARLSQQLVEKDALIGQLNLSLNVAVGAYRQSTMALHRDLPEELIEGDTVNAIDESLKKAIALVARVKSSIAKVSPPLVAATRSRLSTDGLSTEDKIRRGLQR